MVDSCVPISDLTVLFSIAVALMFSVIAFFIMLGKVFARSPWEALARAEFRQVIVSVVLGVVLVGLASTACTVSKYAMTEVIKSPFTDQFRHSSDYLNYLTRIGYNTIKNYWVLVYALNSANSSLRVGDVKVLGIAQLVAKMIERGISLLYAAMAASLIIQQLSIQAAQALAFTILLPIGMVLRTIPLTREGGSFLIALAFGAYIVWPFAFVVNYEVSKVVWQGTNFDQLSKPTVLEELSFQSTKEITTKLFDFANIFALLLPQALALPLINLTLFISFVRMFAQYITNLS